MQICRLDAQGSRCGYLDFQRKSWREFLSIRLVGVVDGCLDRGLVFGLLVVWRLGVFGLCNACRRRCPAVSQGRG